VSTPGGYSGELDAVAVAEFQQSAMAENTGVAYRSDWRQFTRWARLRELAALPASPETVAAYLASMARLTDEKGEWLYAASTLGRRLAAIAKAQQLAGLASPCRDPQVSTTLAGIRRERVRPARRATPLLLADLPPALSTVATPGRRASCARPLVDRLGWGGPRAALLNATSRR